MKVISQDNCSPTVRGPSPADSTDTVLLPVMRCTDIPALHKEDYSQGIQTLRALWELPVLKIP